MPKDLTCKAGPILPVNLKAFRKLRKYAETLSNKQIEMDAYFTLHDGERSCSTGLGAQYSLQAEHPELNLANFNSYCGTAACLAGHSLIALLPAKERKNIKPHSCPMRAEGLLGLQHYDHALFNSNLMGWPEDLRALYQSGKRGARKRALLTLLDRIIAAKGLPWDVFGEPLKPANAAGGGVA